MAFSTAKLQHLAAAAASVKLQDLAASSGAGFSTRFAEVNGEEIQQIIDDYRVPSPCSTKRQTKWSVSIFKEWLQVRYPAESLECLSKETLAERLTKFYQELKQNDGKHYSRSAHVSVRAGINRYLASETVGKMFSIITDPVFRTANKSLSAKLKKIKDEMGSPEMKHHSCIPPEDIQKCYDSGVFGSDSALSLLRVNWFNISLHFRRIRRESQRRLTKNSFVFKTDANEVEYVEMAKQKKTKNDLDSLNDKADDADPKMFSTGDRHCPVQYLKKLFEVLNPGEEALFQRPRREPFCSNNNVWFERAPLGVNTLGSMMKEISTAAKLGQVYTNLSIKATSVTLLDRPGIPAHCMMQVSGHRNEGSVKVYCERQTLQQQKECSETLAKPVAAVGSTGQPLHQNEYINRNEIRFVEVNRDEIQQTVDDDDHDADDHRVPSPSPSPSSPCSTKTTNKQTKWSVSIFKEWLQVKYPAEYLECLSKETLVGRLTKFYQELKQSNGKHYSRSAHVAVRAGINRYLSSETVGKTFSIITDPIFRMANKSFNAKLKKIKLDGLSEVKHHSSIPLEDIQKCYDSGVFGSDSPLSLLRVNWFNINLHFCKRGRENQRKLTKNSFVFKTDANKIEYVEMAEQKKNKNDLVSLSDKADEADSKMFSTGDRNCPVQYLKKLVEVLNPEEEALFQRPKRAFCSSDRVWFERAPLGINTLGSMMKEISTAAKLSQVYTNLSIKATSVTLLDRPGIPAHCIMQVSGHSNKRSVILAKPVAALDSKGQPLHRNGYTNRNEIRAGLHSIILDTNHDKKLETSSPHVEEDDGYFSTYAHYGIHEEMLKDEVRTLSYKNFIERNRHLFEDKVVLDVGCGTGILSIFAAKAGSKKVIGIDKSAILYNAMDIVRENQWQDIITLVRGKVEEVNLEVEKVDVIISEWMGYFLLFESMLDSVLFARDKWLTTNGKVYPDKCTMSLVGLCDQKRTEQKLTYWDDVYGVKMTCMKHFALSEPVIDVVDPNSVLTKNCIIKEIDVNEVKKEELDFKSVFQLDATKNGILNIIVGYFDIYFDGDCTEKISFSTHPSSPPTHWKQSLFYLETPVQLKKGEALHGTLQCSKNTKDVRSLDIVIELKDSVSNEVMTNKYTLQ